jgi:hypothetical protein
VAAFLICVSHTPVIFRSYGGGGNFMRLARLSGAPISAARAIAVAAYLGLLVCLGAPAWAGEQVEFDIPSQPLASALELYSARSGRQVVYDSTLAVDRRSSPVMGSFTPELALERLLVGTGLMPRYMAADAFVLVGVPSALRRRQEGQAKAASPADVARYYGRVQAALGAAFCGNERTRRGGYRAVVALWIGASGVIGRAALIGPTGNAALDAAIARTVGGLAIGAAPPPGFAQPVVLLVVPDLTRECQGGPVQPLPARAGP